MGELLNVLQSLCLPTAIIPLLKLTGSQEIMGTTFKTNNFWKITTWILASIIICINLFLLVLYLEELDNISLGYIFGGIYFVFIGYLSIIPLNGNRNDQQIEN